MADDQLPEPTSQKDWLPADRPREAIAAPPRPNAAYAALLYVMSLLATILFVLALPAFDMSVSSRFTVCGILVGMHALGLIGLLWHPYGRVAIVVTLSMVLLAIGARALGAINPLLVTPFLTETQATAWFGPPLKREVRYIRGTGQRYYTYGSGNPMNPGNVRLSGPHFDNDKRNGCVLRYRNINLYFDAHGRLANWGYGWNMSR